MPPRAANDGKSKPNSASRPFGVVITLQEIEYLAKPMIIDSEFRTDNSPKLVERQSGIFR